MPKRIVITIDTHTAGEPTRIIIGGIPYVPGKTMVEKKEYLKKNLDFIRKALMQEPRGHKDMFGAAVTTPSTDEADLGVVFMDCYGWQDMCGHGCIGVTLAAVEMGLVEVSEPVTTVVLDTPAGLVKGYARIENGNVKSIAIHNVPSFLYKTIQMNIPEIGKIPIDIAFGGNFFAIINAEGIGVSVEMKNVPRLLQIGKIIKETLNREIDVKHPEKPHIDYIQNIRFYDKTTTTHPEAHVKTLTVFSAGRSTINLQVDRSPCGTGTSAHMAMLYAKGQLGLNEESIHESIIGTIFRGKIIKETRVGNYKGVIPEISCKAFVTGLNTWIIDPDDPLKHGFLLNMP